MELNKRLAELRKNKGFTQLELAELLNVSRQAVSRWEVGTASPSLDNLICLSELYGVPLDHFIKEVAEVPEQAAARSNAVRPHTALIPALLAVLILGVGILIGVSIQRNPQTRNRYTVPQSTGNSQITVGWLEITPADLEEEARWRAENGGSEEEQTTP